MNTSLMLKKPKLEQNPEITEEDGHPNDGGGVESSNSNKQDDNIISSSREEQEEAIVALIEHRTKEVEHLRKRVLYYSSQLGQAEKRLHDSESQLARIRCPNNVSPSNKKVKVEIDQVSFTSPPPPQSKPKLLIPSVHHGISRAIDDIEIQEKGNKRKFEENEHKELIPLIRGSSSPKLIRCKGSSHISSQHKRKLRSLALCPVNDNLFVTSALDGVVNLWSLQAKGSGASLLNTTDCVSPKLRKWPEDIAWHPQEYSLFCAYHADGDSQISILNWNKTTDERAQVTFLDDKPHVKGIINSISFLPLDRTCFVTGGSDHSVIIWTEGEGGKSWKPEILHRNQHSSAVMGVTGMQQKQIVISSGADKRIVGFDLHAERTDFKLQIESKCMSVLPNPCDFNLFMVQTGTPERQLRLYDIRLKQTEIHEFGWKQESSESQSALINQAWSPDGFYITSGSADPVIHIFDIRYNAHKPSQSVKAHQKRVFKALWHFSLPLLISTSSDLNIGLHKIT